jgi:hypothetical protein
MLIEVKPEPLKASLPIEVTPSGMVIDFKAEHHEKVPMPIEVTPLGMLIEVKPEQL